jgi:bifunctional non-homologous end joining protein LigD
MARDAPKLKTYRVKRDFTKTAEPSGTSVVSSSKHLRYVIQKHAASHLHYDLRLELDGVFKSWAVTKGPSIDPADKRLAVEVEDHPLDYGDFEGTIPKGQYGGGTVQLWDRGFWAPEGIKTPQVALKEGDLKFILAGERLRGSWVLVRIKHNRGRDTRTNWLLIKHKDEYAKPGGTETLMADDRSVASGRGMDQITRGAGQSPSPFMLATNEEQKADAVWHSNRDRAGTAVSIQTNARRPTQTAKLLKAVPAFIEPQLCKLVDRPPTQAGWAHEVKFDGYRVQVRVVSHQAKIRTRNGLDWTHKFTEIAQAVERLSDCIIDSEIVALTAKRIPSFTALQAALSDRQSQDLVLFAFDLLVEGNSDIRPLPLSDRKTRLKTLLTNTDPGSRVRYVEHIESDGTGLLETARKMELEGIVSKKLAAPYVSGRSGHWVKAKCRAGHEVVVGGWTSENGTVRSLLAGVNRDGHLVYVGRIGTGYGTRAAAQLLPRLKQLTARESPFGGRDPPRKERNIRWLKPDLVAEIQFAGWTASGMIRQAAFKGLREDKRASEVVAEQPLSLTDKDSDPNQALSDKLASQTTPSKKPINARSIAAKPSSRTAAATVMGVAISKPEKALWPDSGDGTPISKLDLARFYEAIGTWMMPHLTGRPCSLLRAPDGIKGQRFFQRHAMAGMSDLFDQIKVKGDREPYLQIDRLEALAAVAQMGALELHPWNCAVNAPEVAGRLVFDLDPAPDVSFEDVIVAALEIQARLRAVGLEAVCKTTGGKGLHVVSPLTGGKRAVAWPTAKNFAHMLCAQMAGDTPTKYLDVMSKAQRKGRIFLDYLRNDRTATAVAVLSPRARDGAPISMPLHWKEVRKGLDPRRFTVRSAPAILGKSKPWADYGASARPLDEAIATLVGRSKTPTVKQSRRANRSR